MSGAALLAALSRASAWANHRSSACSVWWNSCGGGGTRQAPFRGIVGNAPSDLALQQGGVQPALPALQAAAGLRPAVIGRAQRVPQLGLPLGGVAPQEAAPAQVDGDHQTLVAAEAFLHLLHEKKKKKQG